MTNKEIEAVYQIVTDYHEKYLKKHGVKLPKLKDADGNYVKDALVLVYLAAIIKKCSEKVKRGIYKILYNEFKGQDPHEW